MACSSGDLVLKAVFEIAFPPNFAFPPNDPGISRESSDFLVSLRAFFEMKDPK